MLMKCKSTTYREWKPPPRERFQQSCHQYSTSIRTEAWRQTQAIVLHELGTSYTHRCRHTVRVLTQSRVLPAIVVVPPRSVIIIDSELHRARLTVEQVGGMKFILDFLGARFISPGGKPLI